MWRRLTSKSEILAFLETDRIYAGYAIGDLEPGLFELCDWFGTGDASGGGGRVRALALCYYDFKPPVLFLMGDPDRAGELVSGVPLPAEVYLNCLEEHQEAVKPFLAWDEMTSMWRMATDRAAFKPMSGRAIQVDALQPGDAGEVWGLLALSGATAFRPGQMGHGVYRGVRVGKRLVAVAGTHLVSHLFGVAAIGNVFTHQHWRGCGFGTAVTSAVATALLEQGIDNIVLNVGRSNSAALQLYENLGFTRHCSFLEGSARVQHKAP